MYNTPQVGKNVKFYLDCKIYEAWFIHKKKCSMVFLGGVVQLAFLVSSFYRSNINGYAIRLHITHDFAASHIGHFCTPDHTILHSHGLYWVPKYNFSTIVTWGEQLLVQVIAYSNNFLSSLGKDTPASTLFYQITA